MERVKRMNEAFNYLRNKGLIRTQKDLANLMHAAESNISKALKGDEAILTDRFLRRLSAAFGGVFNQEWLLTGKGEMLSASADGEVNIFGNGNALGAAANVTNNTTYGSCSAENSRADAKLNKVLDMLQAAQDRINEIQTQLTEHNATSTKMLDMLQEKDALILRLTNNLLDK